MKNKSFTLIEILVVIIIIGILASIVLFNTNDSTEKRKRLEVLTFSEGAKGKNLDSLVSEWRLDNNTNDDWGHSNAVWGGSGGGNTSANYLSEEECISKNCLDFDGYDDNLLIPYSPGLSLDEVNISFWIKLTSDPNTSSVNNWRNIIKPVSGGAPFYIYLEQNMYVNFSVIVSGVEYRYLGSNFSGELLSVGKWTFLSYSYDKNGYGKSYKDAIVSRSGKMKTSTGVECPGGVLSKSTSDFRFSWPSGTSTPSGSGAIPGIIDEIKIYGASLDQSQIKKEYLAGLDLLLTKGLISEEDYNQRTLTLAQNE